MGKPQVLVVPYPAQGHVIPLLELSQTLVKNGCKVTFVNTNFNHERILNGLGDHNHLLDDAVEFVSIPDGMEPGDDRNDVGKLTHAMSMVMPGKLEELIVRINNGLSGEDRKVACLVADGFLGFAFQVAEKLGIPSAAFWPASAAVVCSVVSIPRLVDEGIIDKDGIPTKPRILQLAPDMPYMNTKDFTWCCIGDLTSQKIMFHFLANACRSMSLPTYKLCNSTTNLEGGAFTYLQDALPVGPLVTSNRQGDQPGGFWKHDSGCLKWLDQQPPSSVVYVAFGSITVLDQTQFQELALGLEHSGKRFLWVVRSDFTNGRTDAYPEGFEDRVRGRGHFVGWAPQQKVLSHPSIACFVSHCGWNSTIEGVRNGLPFLCWPYFADQLFNESYICDVWKVGSKFERNENGIITGEEIRDKIEQVLGDEELRKRALNIKRLLQIEVSDDGQSSKNLKKFIQFVKKND